MATSIERKIKAFNVQNVKVSEEIDPSSALVGFQLKDFFTVILNCENMSDLYENSFSGSSTASSDSEEDNFDKLQELCDDFAKLKPYDFEPLASTDESDSEESYTTDNEEEEGVQRKGKKDWCTCGCCEPMMTEIECYCCQEANEITDEKFEGKIIHLYNTIFIHFISSTQHLY